MNNPSNNKKTFKPIILYDTTRLPNNDTHLERVMLEEHKLKIKDMLERNAKFWENPSASSSKILASDQHQSFFKRKSIVLNDIQSDEIRSPLLLDNNNPHQLLEPRMQNNPLPLHNHEFSATRKATESPYNHELLIAKYDKSDEEEEEGTNEQYYKTQFINEPQHHLTYKPHIDRKRRRGNLPKHVTEYLKHWLLLHKSHPYPTEGEKQKLADETGLFVNQISNWFINARRRILQPLLDSEDIQQEDEEIDIPTPNMDANVNNNFICSAPFASTSSNIHISGESSSDHRIRSSYTEQSNHNYLLNEPSEYNAEDDPTHNTSNVPPPPWVLLPTKLPSMNILEKDLEAFHPKK